MIVFTDNKYTKWYYNIIKNAKNRELSKDIYSERHHIIPRSLNGNDHRDNLVKLTAREHFVCHLLLTKMVNGPDYYKMLSAVTRFQQCSSTQKRTLTSWEYQKIRKCVIEARKGQRHTDETRQKIKDAHQDVSGKNNPMHGILGEENPNSKRWWALDPQGLEYDFIGLTNFCEQYKLTDTCIINVAKGRRSHHKGWKFGYINENGNKVIPTPIISKDIKGSNNPNAKTYHLVDPCGNLYIVTGGLASFCALHKLSIDKVYDCVKGRIESYKEWTVKYG
jgi:hypothetical protein